MTTYADFQDYFLRVMWREGDAALITDLPVLIRKAEARIRRDIRENSLTVQTTMVSTDMTVGMVLPTGYREAKAVWLDSDGAGQGGPYAAPATNQQYQVYADRFQFNKDCRGKFFTIIGNLMFTLHDGTVTDPVTINMIHYADLVAFETDPVDPDNFYDNFPDFYEAALKVQVYDYMREFESSAEYNGMYDKLLEGMRLNSMRQEFPAGPIDAPLPGVVA